ncbi:hypothetical protein [Flavobacterium turcicum]|uniref:Uncharacterized protein n=1 Tax=Flavobacterium turcicum TaxID=2764718 RepID=A0ABR7JEW7_9FLAO|nr:hypothetical protein [Flavobacterium turcicum]MBC5863025.1 hypothetical protein [Flavobacterium turcicum]NHL01757.1 hypothetical protein [Flavobacterium turcicum]
MKIYCLLFLTISTLCFSQNNSESDVLKKIIDEQIGMNTFGIYVQCEKHKTFFDLKEFKEETGLEVPEKILYEIEANVAKSNGGTWNSELIKELNYSSDLIKNIKCLTKKEAEEIFIKTKKIQKIISISEPIFDNNYENCIVSVIYSTFTHSASGYSYFLKKVYGKWTVIAVYGIWMT